MVTQDLLTHRSVAVAQIAEKINARSEGESTPSGCTATDQSE